MASNKTKTEIKFFWPSIFEIIILLIVLGRVMIKNRRVENTIVLLIELFRERIRAFWILFFERWLKFKISRAFVIERKSVGPYEYRQVWTRFHVDIHAVLAVASAAHFTVTVPLTSSLTPYIIRTLVLMSTRRSMQPNEAQTACFGLKKFFHITIFKMKNIYNEIKN